MICARHKGRPYSSAISAAVPARTLASALASCFGPSVRPTILRSALAVPPVATAQRGSGDASPANARSTLAWTRSSSACPGGSSTRNLWASRSEPMSSVRNHTGPAAVPNTICVEPPPTSHTAMLAGGAGSEATTPENARRPSSSALSALHRQPRRARDRVDEVVGVLALTAGSGHEDVHLGGAELHRVAA